MSISKRKLFIIVQMHLIIIGIIGIIGLSIIAFKGKNKCAPFRQMRKKEDFDNCYDLKNKSYYYGNTNKKKR